MASLMRRHQKNKNLGDPRFPSRRVPEYWPDLHEDAVDSRFIVQKLERETRLELATSTLARL
ncbi:MAG TPA: hypothetical protein PLF47_12355, partial [Dokdonella sp.]|nr:hypothetical protein [Dokdonella sp.]